MIHVPVQGFIFMRVQFVDDRLDAQHQKLVTQMDPEFQTGLKKNPQVIPFGNPCHELFHYLQIKEIKNNC